MIALFGFLILILCANVVDASGPEFGHPLFRTFTAHDYGDAYEIYAATQDQEGRMLFGCQDASKASWVMAVLSVLKSQDEMQTRLDLPRLRRRSGITKGRGGRFW